MPSQPKTQKRTRTRSFWTSFFITSNGVWPQTKPSFIPANSAFRASLSQLWSFTRALMYHISLCFSCMAVSESQGSKGEIKQKLFKVWQGLESQNSLLSLQPYFYWGPVQQRCGLLQTLKKKKRGKQRCMREDYWGSLDLLSPWRRKCFKFLTAGQVFTHREYVQAPDVL